MTEEIYVPDICIWCGDLDRGYPLCNRCRRDYEELKMAELNSLPNCPKCGEDSIAINPRDEVYECDNCKAVFTEKEFWETVKKIHKEVV